MVSGIQLSDTKSDTKIVKSKIMALGLTDSTTSMQLLKSAPLICDFGVINMDNTASTAFKVYIQYKLYQNVTKRWLICNIAVHFMLKTSNLEYNIYQRC